MEPHSGLTNLDYIVIALILGSGLLALMRGFVRELFSLIAWIGAYFASVKYYHLATPWVHHYLKNDQTAEWGAMALVYVVALVVLMIIGSLICHFAIRGRALTAIDRSLGFLFGLARGVFVIAAIYAGAVIFIWPDLDKPPPTPQEQAALAQQENKEGHYEVPEFLQHAKTRPLMAYFGKQVAGLIPKDMVSKTLQEYTNQKKAAQHDIDQKMLDTLSTPAPQPPTTNTAKPEQIDTNKILNKGTNP